MDNICMVCLENYDDTTHRIHITSEEWLAHNMLDIIKKHLCWWNENNCLKEGQWLCRQCWEHLRTFSEFFNRVQEQHQQLKTILKEYIVETSLNSNTDEIMIKEENPLNTNSFEVQSMPPAAATAKLKRNRGRSKKRFEIENISMDVLIKDETTDELPILQKEQPPSPIDLNKNDAFTKIDEFLSEDECMPNQSSDQDDNNEINAEDQDDDDNVLSSAKKMKAEKKQQTKTPRLKTKLKKAKSFKKKPTTISPITSQISNTMKKNDEFLKELNHEFSCCICSEELPNFSLLKTHFRKQHRIRGYALCCGKKYFKRSMLVDHLHVHTNPNHFKCTECDKVLASRYNLSLHMELHKPKTTDETLNRCEECNKTFTSKCNYKRHMLSHLPEEEKHFACEECGKRFATGYMRRQHKNTVHLNKYVRICDLCGQGFRERFAFERHMEEHEKGESTKVPCDVCGALLKSKHSLSRHMKAMHKEENLLPQQCPHCDKIASSKSALRYHIDYNHKKARNYACHLCDKAFRRPKELKEHLSVHTGEPLYTCPHCPRTFISSANMHKHRKIAHRKEWEENRKKRMAPMLLKQMAIEKQNQMAAIESSEQKDDSIINFISDSIVNPLDRVNDINSCSNNDICT